MGQHLLAFLLGSTMAENRLKQILGNVGAAKLDLNDPSRRPDPGDPDQRPKVTDDELTKFALATPMRTVKMASISMTCQAMGIKIKPALCHQSRDCQPDSPVYDAVQINFNDGHVVRVVFCPDETDSMIFMKDPADSKDVSDFMTMYLDNIFQLQRHVYGDEYLRECEAKEGPAVRMEKISLETGIAIEGFDLTIDQIGDMTKKIIDPEQKSE